MSYSSINSAIKKIREEISNYNRELSDKKKQKEALSTEISVLTKTVSSLETVMSKLEGSRKDDQTPIFKGMERYSNMGITIATLDVVTNHQEPKGGGLGLTTGEIKDILLENGFQLKSGNIKNIYSNVSQVISRLAKRGEISLGSKKGVKTFLPKK